MDRRKRKTRQAIFSAFSELLQSKNLSDISVQEIIDRADVGRATFYSHFETKEYLLRALCEELFSHITDAALGLPHEHCSFCCGENESVFLHLYRHLMENDYNVLGLLRSENNEIFLRFFKRSLCRLIDERSEIEEGDLPRDYAVNQVAACFVETVYWWLSRGCGETPEQLEKYFLVATAPFFKKW